VKTRAALFRAPEQPLEVVELDLEEPGPGEVLVRMAAVGVCGSDLHVVRGEWRRPTPMVLGHEGAGVVEAVGADVASVAPGDAVVISWAPACGECVACRSGRRQACEPLRAAISAGTLPDGTTKLSLGGETVYRMTATGCLSEHTVLAAAAALPLGDGIPLEQAALLGCAALTGVGAVRNAGNVQPGDYVLVVGAGGVGQFVVQGARLAGAGAIVCVDPNEARLDQARELGAAAVGPPEEVAALLPDGADVSFDAVGAPETTSLALAATRAGGRCVVVGMPAAGARFDLDPLEFTNREKTLTGSVYGSADPAEALPGLLDDVRNGRLELESLVGPSYPLDRVDEAFRASLAGAAGRVLVTP
jgi:S-(hydroxymethyl)glutathione dehydrogenase / alcohol dehydrogenase